MRGKFCLLLLTVHLVLGEGTQTTEKLRTETRKTTKEVNSGEAEAIQNLTSESEDSTNNNNDDRKQTPTPDNEIVENSAISTWPKFRDISDLDAKYLVNDFDYVIEKINNMIESDDVLKEHAEKISSKTPGDDPGPVLEEAISLGHDQAKLLLAKLHFYGDLVDLDLNRSFQLFSELAEKGYADANLYLGFMYALGLGPEPVNQAKALLYYTFAAASNSTFAKMALGYRYWLGINVAHNCEKALAYYRQVAAKVEKTITFSGNIGIQRIRLLDELENTGSISGALDDDLIQYYQFLADKGDVNAQLGLGKLHYQGGFGVEHDPDRAFHYFQLATESGNTNAMTFLGKMYLEGSRRIERNYGRAMKYFKMAADNGNPVGQSGMGIMYFLGHGVPKDYKMAAKYFTQAASQGWVDGQIYMGIMHLNGYGIPRDPKMAIKYFTLASQSGHILGYYHLAEMHATGTGTLRSCTTAVELFKSVCEKGPWGVAMMEAYNDFKEGRKYNAFVKYATLSEFGYETAQTNAAFILEREVDSSLFPKNELLSRAFIYWSRAASQGYSAARVKLGDYYYYGLGTSINYEQAANQYRIASEQQSNAQALFNLGYMYEAGLGLKKDIYLAKRYYDLAAITSVEAQVPVALALVKLFFVFIGDYLQSINLKEVVSFSHLLDFGTNWDLYIVTFLIVLLSTILYGQRRLG